MKETFAGTVREVLQDLGKDGAEIIIQEAAVDPRLDLVFDKDKRPLYNTVRDMMLSGEVLRVRPGAYKYIGRMKSPEMQEIMWKVLRSRKTLTVEDLQQMSGASENYTKEWLQMLMRRKIIRRNKNNTFTLIRDPGPVTPRNEEKAAKLRRIRREKKKAAIEAVDQVAGDILSSEPMEALMHNTLEARMAIMEIPED